MLRQILLWYLIIAAIVLVVYLKAFLDDPTTPKNDLLSWLVLLIAPLFWLLVLPLSYRELVAKNQVQSAQSLDESELLFQDELMN